MTIPSRVSTSMLTLSMAACVTIAFVEARRQDDRGADAHAPQESADERPTFRIRSDLVTVDAVVTDKDGRHVTDLTADDFEVMHAGRPQQLRHAVYVPIAGEPLTTQRGAVAPRQGDDSRDAGRPRSLGEALRRPPPRFRRTIAIVVDDLGLSFESTAFVRSGLRQFIDRQMNSDDLVAVVRTSGGIGTLQQFTQDRRQLHAAVERVRWTVTSRSGIGAFAPVLAGENSTKPPVPGSVVEDSIDEIRHRVLVAGSLGALDFVVRGMQNLPGRKAIVFVSEGFDLFNRRGEGRTWSMFTRLMDHANRAGVVLYTVDARGLETNSLTAEDNPQLGIPMVPGEGNEGDGRLRELILDSNRDRQTTRRNSEETLHYMAWQTGGFAILNNNRVHDALRQVAEDLQGYYLLGYDAPSGPSGWDPDRIRVSVKRPGLRVRSRRGFFGPAEEEPSAPEGIANRLTLAAMSPFGSDAIALRLTSLFAHDRQSGAYIRSLLFIDPAGLTFTQGGDGRHEAAAEIVQLAVGDNGELVGDWRRRLTFSLTDEQLADARRTGFLYSTRMGVAEAGGYQVRVAVMDAASGATGSASQFLEVPDVGRRRLALSGLLLQADGPAASQAAEPVVNMAGLDADQATADVLGRPALRIFQPGTNVRFAYEIYDGTDPSDPLLARTALARNGRVVFRSNPQAIARPKNGSNVRVIPVGGLLTLGREVPPGDYTLEVAVESGGKRRAAQWIDLEVRR